MRLELVERRALGAVRFLDATTVLPVRSPLAVTGDALRLVRNRQGLYVVVEASGLEAHTESFLTPPPQPAVDSLHAVLTVSDPGGRYLPRRLALDLPRDPNPNPDPADQDHSLFRPVDAFLYPAPAASVAPGWAVIRATVIHADTQEPLGGALLRATWTLDGTTKEAKGFSEWRGPALGEALVAVPGIPITTWGTEGPVLIHEVPVSLEAFFDPDFDPAAGQAPDPDDLESRESSAQIVLTLASGRTEKATLAVP